VWSYFCGSRQFSLVGTGLTGVGQWTRVLCSAVFSGLQGWELVPRFSSTPVAAWTWPTWVVSRRHVLEAVFVLLESPSPSRRIFIGSHSLPPLWFAVSVMQSIPLVHKKAPRKKKGRAIESLAMGRRRLWPIPGEPAAGSAGELIGKACVLTLG
jgi:hypothetical protein